ncbi:MAG: class I SAM-dependent methyltransferase [Sphingobacteriales bacterium]|nr:MAG: class I SAM-dependent methyltransferase [Sphingobacteriales bacterium]
MFTKTADYYDALYHFKDYKAACNHIDTFIKEQSIDAKSLLDVGCGTGQHLAHLQEYYAVEGLDLNEELLAVARERCPDVTFHHDNMTTFRLNKTFDVVGCFFSSIAYVQTVDGLNKAVAAMEKHLKPNGLLLIEPWITPEKYWMGKVTANFVDQPELKIAWMYTSEVEDKKSIFDIQYMVGTPAGIEQFNEKHVMGLWTDEEYRQAFKNVGLEAHYDEKGFFGRGLYFATKQ